MNNEFKAIRRDIAKSAVDYFTIIGKILLECNDAKADVSILSMDENWNISNVRDIVHISNELGGYIGDENIKDLSKKLFGTRDITYRDFSDRVYKMLCEKIQGGMEYVPYHISSLKTFKDLYHYIQTCATNEFGYRIISEFVAIHIYPSRVQFDVCTKNEFGKWIPMLNFIFDIDNDDIIVHTVCSEDDVVSEDGQEIEINMLITDLYLISAMPKGFEVQNILVSLFEK